jgi:hypothetical protein
MAPQEDGAGHRDDVTRTAAIETVETVVTDLGAAVASNGKKSAKMIGKEERRG